MARVLSRTTQPILGHGACRKQKGAAGVLLAVLLLSGCSEGGKGQKLAERIGCSGSYEAVTTDALGVQEVGRCTFRDYELSLVTFANNGGRNSYICSTCGFDVDTDAAAIEQAARRFGGRFVAGDRYLIKVPNAAADRLQRRPRLDGKRRRGWINRAEPRPNGVYHGFVL